jgi:hypothetical protein
MRVLFAAAVLAGLAGLAGFPGTAQAQRFSSITGAKLAELCASRDQRQVEGCTAYIDGIADAAGFYQRLRPMDGSRGGTLPGYVCIPAPTTGAQLRTAFVDWMKKHADQGQRQASGVVLRALDDNFVCPGERPRLSGQQP